MTRRLAAMLVIAALVGCGPDGVVVASKAFTEGVILGELCTQVIDDGGQRATHKSQLGGTAVVYEALKAGEIHAYVEYTGTLLRETFARRRLRSIEELREALAADGIRMSAPLGFSNSYGLGMPRERAEALGITSISDLRSHPSLRFGFSNEFMDREDTWRSLKRRYRLRHQDVAGMEHALAYRGLSSGDLDVTDVYTTDADIRKYDLVVLKDDLGHFPDYDAVILYRADLDERAVAALRRLEGVIDEREMIAMNAAVQVDRRPESEVAAAFLQAELGIAAPSQGAARLRRILGYTIDHLKLVVLSMLAAIFVAIPLGVVAARRRRVGQVILSGVGIIQTIPSLALLVFMIPVFGLYDLPAVVALFLYSLLPIVRNTHAGITAIPGPVRESAEALGLPPSVRLRRIELPLASPAILAGVKTAAVINVGTATLGAIIGAGGYGQPILAGVRTGQVDTILIEGAIPAAAMAVVVQVLFELAERWIVPRGLRIKRR